MWRECATTEDTQLFQLEDWRYQGESQLFDEDWRYNIDSQPIAEEEIDISDWTVEEYMCGGPCPPELRKGNASLMRYQSDEPDVFDPTDIDGKGDENVKNIQEEVQEVQNVKKGSADADAAERERANQGSADAYAADVESERAKKALMMLMSSAESQKKTIKVAKIDDASQPIVIHDDDDADDGDVNNSQLNLAHAGA